ncbi:rhamnogalacturonan endolyase [Granulicella rosea]|uniref:rhamnogalacturonan endolyase n=1 Tax=Granulicella rosea TaxID=474952 RepID=A0A239GUY7_9BACT|nr:polysaccharide lyase family 4 protein [Granulicella rosea]SNS72682.1 rhamnogalacturonan endolyase [Granulicella rosea]
MLQPALKHLIAAWTLCMLAFVPAHANVPGGSGDLHAVTLAQHGEEYDLANGNVSFSIDGPTATIADFHFHKDELVNRNGRHDQIYWSMDGGESYQNPGHCQCFVKTNTPDMVDVGCKEKYTGAQPHAFDIEIHYVLRRGATGIYVYALLSHPASYPATSVGEWRVVWQTPSNGGKWLLEKIYVDNTRHWVMPTPDELEHRIPTPIKEISFFRSGPWANRGESKYTYSATYEDIGTFGFASDVNKLGAWTVLGGFDYYNDGPRKQDLTALDGGMTHHFGRNHYGDTGIHVDAGEEWSKIFGPFLLYANGGSDGDTLWHDAQKQAAAEQAAWPYTWLTGVPEYPPAAQRGGVLGTFTIADKLKPTQTAKGAWIGLAQPPPGLDFQSETKNYQYWSHVAADGTFSIPSVRPGVYTLYAFVDGEVGQYVQRNVTVTAGTATQLGNVQWTIPRTGDYLAWEIGKPDRDSTEFHHGNDYFMPYLYKGFALEFPNPLVYTVGVSKPGRDWNYAQSSYRKDKADPEPWRWRIDFNLAQLPAKGDANLIIAIAGSDRAHVQVSVNGDAPLTTFTPEFGGGNALLRQGSHGKYSVKNVAIPVSKLHVGKNSIELVNTDYKLEPSYVMYDYLALEMPGSEQ